MNRQLAESIFKGAERASLLSLSLHEHLLVAGLVTLAREAMVLHLGSIEAVEQLGDLLGIDPVPLAAPARVQAKVVRLERASQC